MCTWAVISMIRLYKVMLVSDKKNRIYKSTEPHMHIYDDTDVVMW